MSKNEKTPEQDEKAAQDAADADRNGTTDEDAPVVEEAAELTPEAVLSEELFRLQDEVAKLKDQLLRALAETENTRNRARREREDLQKYAAAPLAKDLLAVADNLRRAIENVPGELVEGDERVRNLVTGIEMTEKTLLAALAKHHVTPIDPAGEKLDPHRHEAMFEIPDESQPNGTVVQVFEIGYALHDRLLRPARVAVAKGGGKAPPAGEAGSDAESQSEA
jgi:molecular chaperone GrpE